VVRLLFGSFSNDFRHFTLSLTVLLYLFWHSRFDQCFVLFFVFYFIVLVNAVLRTLVTFGIAQCGFLGSIAKVIAIVERTKHWSNRECQSKYSGLGINTSNKMGGVELVLCASTVTFSEHEALIYITS
jgi:hypothetical protein